MIKSMFGFLTDVKKLAIVAMLIAIALVIRTWITIDVTPFIKIDIGAVAIIFAIGILFGPFAGAIAGFSVDFLSALIKPVGPYNPIISIAFVCYGLIAGFLFFKKNKEFNRSNLILIDVVVLLSYLIGFAIITFGIAWAISTNPDPTKQMMFNEALAMVFTGRSLSLLHAVWYLVLTPTLVFTGEKLMFDWQNK
jgi:ECF transporter S component (folate family)